MICVKLSNIRSHFFVSLTQIIVSRAKIYLGLLFCCLKKRVLSKQLHHTCSWMLSMNGNTFSSWRNFACWRKHEVTLYYTRCMWFIYNKYKVEPILAISKGYRILTIPWLWVSPRFTNIGQVNISWKTSLGKLLNNFVDVYMILSVTVSTDSLKRCSWFFM